jgi:hypothetical protein
MVIYWKNSLLILSSWTHKLKQVVRTRSEASNSDGNPSGIVVFVSDTGALSCQFNICGHHDQCIGWCGAYNCILNSFELPCGQLRIPILGYHSSGRWWLTGAGSTLLQNHGPQDCVHRPQPISFTPISINGNPFRRLVWFPGRQRV